MKAFTSSREMYLFFFIILIKNMWERIYINIYQVNNVSFHTCKSLLCEKYWESNFNEFNWLIHELYYNFTQFSHDNYNKL